MSADQLNTDASQGASKSRQSAVKIVSGSLNFWGGSSTTTGTYVVANDKHYIITVAHGIQGPCALISIIHDDQYYSCVELLKIDPIIDYVIMEVDGPLSDRIPLRVPGDLPHGTQWNNSYSILTNIIYTGYPNTRGPLTLKGNVIGYGEDEYLYVFSHAYGGSSGSGVFTEEGKYIGYIVAIDVGGSDHGTDVLENIVIVAPAFNIDWSVILN